MDSNCCTYFFETPAREYTFIGFYKYRRQQADFTFSFRKEANKLVNDLEYLSKDDSEEVRTAVIQLKQKFKDHREKYEDVRLFWTDIESLICSSNIESDKAKAARTISQGTANSVPNGSSIGSSYFLPASAPPNSSRTPPEHFLINASPLLPIAFRVVV